LNPKTFLLHETKGAFSNRKMIGAQSLMFSISSLLFRVASPLHSRSSFLDVAHLGEKAGVGELGQNGQVGGFLPSFVPEALWHAY
jgi:hypothetical protein